MEEQTHLLEAEQTREKRAKKKLIMYKKAMIVLHDCLLDHIQVFRDQMTRRESLDEDVVSVDRLSMKRFISVFNLYLDTWSSLPNRELVPKLPKKDFDLALKIVHLAAVYKALKTVEPAGSGTAEEEDKCVICLEELVVGSCSDDARALHCGHKFHEICIVRWLRKKNCCPLCRCEIIQGMSY